MGKVLEAIDERLSAWIGRQHVFFVATAPSQGGHVNVSPKGQDTLVVLDPRTVAYADLTGSGVETIAHLRDNGRVTIMLCAFEGPPDIVRLFGSGEVLLAGTAEHEELRPRFPDLPGVRSIIRVRLERVQTSCGFAVPLMDFAGNRTLLSEWTQRRTDEQLAEYQATRNQESIDGLPGLAGLRASSLVQGVGRWKHSVASDARMPSRS